MAEILLHDDATSTQELTAEIPKSLEPERRAALHKIVDPNKKMTVLERGLELQEWLQANGTVPLSQFDVSDDELAGALAVWQDLCCEVCLAPQLPSPAALYKGLESIDPANIDGHMWSVQDELAVRLNYALEIKGTTVPLQIQNRYVGLREAAAGRSFEIAEQLKAMAELMLIAASVER